MIDLAETLPALSCACSPGLSCACDHGAALGFDDVGDGFEDALAATVGAIVPFVRVRTQFNPDGFELKPGQMLATTPGGGQPSAAQELLLELTKPEIEIGLANGRSYKLTTSHGPPTTDLRPYVIAGGVALGLVGLGLLAAVLL